MQEVLDLSIIKMVEKSRKSSTEAMGIAVNGELDQKRNRRRGTAVAR